MHLTFDYTESIKNKMELKQLHVKSFIRRNSNKSGSRYFRFEILEKAAKKYNLLLLKTY